jgi:hypothetical protein
VVPIREIQTNSRHVEDPVKRERWTSVQLVVPVTEIRGLKIDPDRNFFFLVKYLVQSSWFCCISVNAKFL